MNTSFQKISFNLIGKNHISDNMDHYPPCMHYLLQSFKETGYLKHNYRLQVGTFLKRIGMDVETQLRFWYDSSVDNVGISFEAFKKRAGYQIRHLYGLEGSKTDYEVSSCKKNFTDNFCLFAHVNTNELNKILPLMYKSHSFQGLREFNEVINHSLNHRSIDACSKMFTLLFKKGLRVYHPLLWVKNSLDAKENQNKVETNQQ
jgi:DNA primase large subunit